YQGRDLLHLLHLRRMSRVWHEFHPRTRDAADELPGVYGRYEGVLLTPDHERRGLHAMDAMLEPLVRDGPDKLGRTSQGPQELGPRQTGSLGVGGRGQETPDRLGMEIREQHLRYVLHGQTPSVPHRDWRILPPQTAWRHEDQFAHPVREMRRQFAGQHAAKRMAYQG